MAIESTPPAPAAEKASPSNSRNSKAKPGDADPAAEGGFMALMALLGQDATSLQEGTPVDALDQAALGTVDDAQGAILLEARTKDGDQAQAIASADMVGVDPAPVAVNSVPTPMPTATRGQRPTVSLDQAGRSIAKEGKSGSTTSKALDLLQDLLSPTATANLQTLSIEGGGPADAKASDFKLQATAEALRAQSKESAGPSAPAASTSAVFGMDKAPERLHGKHEAMKGLMSNDAPTPLGMASSAGGPAVTTLAAPQMSASLEVAVAEKVAYWIGQDVQNAELQLDGLGKDAVQVSISMVGNEAQVTFRTDESVTRDALQAASGQLKDMLLREGVLLSGVSIGQSGSGGAQDGQRQARQGQRQVGTVVANVEAAVAATRPTHLVSGRTVDLFV